MRYQTRTAVLLCNGTSQNESPTEVIPPLPPDPSTSRASAGAQLLPARATFTGPSLRGSVPRRRVAWARALRTPRSQWPSLTVERGCSRSKGCSGRFSRSWRRTCWRAPGRDCSTPRAARASTTAGTAGCFGFTPRRRGWSRSRLPTRRRRSAGASSSPPESRAKRRCRRRRQRARRPRGRPRPPPDARGHCRPGQRSR